MRAYAYYRLLIDWGPTLLLGNDIIPNNEELKNYDRERGTYDECVDYICNEFEESAKYLPTTQSIANFGRPTKGAAYEWKGSMPAAPIGHGFRKSGSVETLVGRSRVSDELSTVCR